MGSGYRPTMTAPTGLLALGDERFVSLSTFRRSGAEVATPVWVARDGDALVVTTAARSGKVTRLRRDARVRLRPCDRLGRVADSADGTTVAEGVATVVDDPGAQRAPLEALRRKYGLEYRVLMLVERVVRGGPSSRVVLRVTPPDAVRRRDPV